MEGMAPCRPRRCVGNVTGSSHRMMNRTVPVAEQQHHHQKERRERFDMHRKAQLLKPTQQPTTCGREGKEGSPYAQHSPAPVVSRLQHRPQ